MTRPNPWLLVYQWGAGLCDATTGVLLMAAPVFTLHLMRLAVLPQPLAFVRFVGAFVCGVGLSYLWPAAALPPRDWRVQWTTTAIIRSAVALLLTWQVAAGAMETGWLAVVATDASLAALQWIGLARNWLARAG